MCIVCRFDWFIKSRTALELQRRCNSLITCIEKVTLLSFDTLDSLIIYFEKEMNDLEDQAKMEKKRSNKVLKEKIEEKPEKLEKEERIDNVEKEEKIEKKVEALEEVEEDNKMVVEA